VFKLKKECSMKIDPKMPDLEELVKIVQEASAPIATAFGQPLAYEEKDGRTDAAAAVTAIDRAIQAKLMEALPGDFMGEEEGERITGSKLVWLTDPLDGTGARIRGLATSTCIVTLMEVHDGIGKPIMTVIHNPVTRQTWSAESHGVTFYQYADNTIVDCPLLTHAPLPSKILSTITLWPGSDLRFDEVKKATEESSLYDNQDFGALGLAHATVATGTTHLSACRASAAYETAAAALLMKGSGGVVYSLEGENLILDGFPIQNVRGKMTFAIPNGAIVASSEAVAQEFLNLVRTINA
jgi:fructose-1,6-bisphosphatase/inositol monophosphatase family enzyme